MRPPESPLASWFGNVLVGGPGESWPVDRGRPMMPLCQLNLTEAPFRPEVLADVALLTVFIDAEELPASTPNGNGWLLRAYPSLDNLVVLSKPTDVNGGVKPYAVRWELVEEDFPCWDDASGMNLPPDVSDDYDDLFENREGTKIGGWPSLIQSEIYWAPFNKHPAHPEFAFQINSEPKAHWAWGDGGVGYFGRGTGEHRGEWTLEWQCY